MNEHITSKNSQASTTEVDSVAEYCTSLGKLHVHGKRTPGPHTAQMNSHYIPQYSDRSASHFRGGRRQFSHQANQHAYSSDQRHIRPACMLNETRSLNPCFFNGAGPVYMYPHPYRATWCSTQNYRSGNIRGRGLHHSRRNMPNSGLFVSHTKIPTKQPVIRYSSSNAAQPALQKSPADVEESYDKETSSSPHICHADIEDGTIQRQWEYTEYGRAHMARRKPGVEFTILSYNVLSQQLLENNSYLYPHCSEDDCQWENRRTRLLQEITSYKPDVLCLQEVQENHYEDFFLPRMCDLGYEGIFQKRTGDKPDGCTIFVKRSLFKISDIFPIIFNQGDLLDRDNVALIVKLTAEREGKEMDMFVATTHLLFNPRRGDIKLAQLSLLFAELDKLAHQNSPMGGSGYSPIVLCGDFNTQPHSDIYKFVVRGFIQYEGLLCRTLSGQQDGNRGRDIYLGKQLLPPHVKITDQCQYFHSLVNRNVQVPESVCTVFKTNFSTSSAVSEEKQIVYANTPVHEACNTRETTSKLSSPSVTSINDSDLPPTGIRNCPPVSYKSGCLWHKLNLVSAYKHSIERLWHSSAEITTHHQYASCTLDYIFYNVRSKQTRTKSSRVVTRNIEEDRLRLIGRYGLLSSKEIKKMGGLPNKYLASDHLGLLTKFLLQ